MAYYLMGKGEGHYFGRQRINHSASSKLFDFLTELSLQWGRRHPGYPFGLGDISRAGAEDKPFDGHVSHVNGQAVDIFLIGTKRRKDSGVEQRTKAQLELTPELLAKLYGKQSPPKSKPNQPTETVGADSETMEVVFSTEARINFSQTALYDLERTTDLVDLILDLSPNWPIFQFIYDDKRVRPEYRLDKWMRSQAKAKFLAEDSLTYFKLDQIVDPKNKPKGGWPVYSSPPLGVFRASGIISVKTPGHADHIHIRLE